MSAPNMATITESLERSFQNCTLSHRQRSTNGCGGLGAELSFRQTTLSSSDSPENHHHYHLSDATLDLNSQISLPYYWERCLDLKSGEIYYINWRTGMKATEDPRTSKDLYSEYEDEDKDDDDDDDDDDDNEDDDDSTSSYEDSEEGYSSERVPAAAAASSSSKRDEQYHYHQQQQQQTDHERDEKHVLVVAGCKGCLMYFMVPKQVEDCPKCTAQLLHFDR